jgi:hypothetical protein
MCTQLILTLFFILTSCSAFSAEINNKVKDEIELIHRKMSSTFGAVRILQDNKSEYYVFAKEKAFGIVKEDIFLYQIKQDKIIPIAEIYNLKKICVNIEKRGENLVFLDREGELIVLISLD